MGLSPLTRGNPKNSGATRLKTGPIPAHAGEPINQTRAIVPAWAYPRSRGGTPKLPTPQKHQKGLSPLTRGNLFSCPPYADLEGPIPAHAGEPNVAELVPYAKKAYPRSRGGTRLTPTWHYSRQGLSPLTRGNPLAWNSAMAPQGPIPAHAGEP